MAAATTATPVQGRTWTFNFDGITGVAPVDPGPFPAFDLRGLRIRVCLSTAAKTNEFKAACRFPAVPGNPGRTDYILVDRHHDRELDFSKIGSTDTHEKLLDVLQASLAHRSCEEPFEYTVPTYGSIFII